VLSLELYKFLESNRWNSATDIPWDQFNDSLTDIQARWMRNNCLGEFTTISGTYAFMRDFSDDPDFCSFIGVWLFEEQKHFLVQYEYLKRFRPDLVPTLDQIQNVNITFEPVANRCSILFLHHCEELEVMNVYLNVSTDFTDPVAKTLYKTLAADESRHSKIFFDFCVKYLEKDYYTAADGFSKIALFLTSDRTNKHPVLNTVNKTEPGLGSVQSRKPEPNLYSRTWSTSMQQQDPSILRNKYLNSLSRLLGREFTCAKDILKFRKELKIR
jgi:hypothetical protein